MKRSRHEQRVHDSAMQMITGKPPKGMDAGTPSVRVHVERSFYPKLEVPAVPEPRKGSGKSTKPFKPAPMDVRVVAVKKGAMKRGG